MLYRHVVSPYNLPIPLGDEENIPQECPNQEKRLWQLKKIYLRKNVLVPFVIQKVDNSIQWVNLYPVESAIGFADAYLLDSDLSNG